MLSNTTKISDNIRSFLLTSEERLGQIRPNSPLVWKSRGLCFTGVTEYLQDVQRERKCR